MVMGYRLSESTSVEAQLESAAEYSQRISGIVRVYWEIVKVQLRFPDRAFMDGPGSGQRVDPSQSQEAQGNLQSPFGINRFWVWFARMAAVRPFLETGVGASLVHGESLNFKVPIHNLNCLSVALDVMGAEAADIWGWQWVKVLELVYEGATNGLYPERGLPPPLPAAGHQEKIQKKDDDGDRENVTIGGNTPDGRAARARVQIEVERIVSGERKAL
jgi:nucleoporin GLE1